MIRSASLWCVTAVLTAGTLTVSATGYWAVAYFQAGVYLVALTVLLSSGLTWPRTAPDTATLLMAAPMVCGLMQLAVGTTTYAHATWTATLQWGALWCVGLLVRNAVQAREVLHRFLSIFLGGAVLLALYVLAQPGMGTFHLGGLLPVRTEEMAGPFQNRNTYASFMELALPVAAWHGLRSRGSGWIFWMAIGIMFASVVSSGSRAGSALVLAEMAVLMIAAWWRRMAAGRTILLAAAQMATLAAAWVMLAGWHTLWTRLQFSDPMVDRRDIFSSAIEMILERPWTGFGLGTFSHAYPRFARFDNGRLVNFAHNDWLQWGAEGGVLLLAAMVILALWCVRPACRHLWGLGVLFVFLHACVDYPLQRAGLAGWVVAMVASLSAAETTASARHANEPESKLCHAPRIEEIASVQ